MLPYLVLVATALLGATKVIIQSKLTRNLLNNTTDFAFFNAVVAFGIGLTYFVQNGFTFCKGNAVIYAISYSFFISAFQLCYTIALKMGPISITALLSNFSVGFTVLFGILYFNEKLTIINIIGFAFMVASLILSVDFKNLKNQKKQMSWKWLLASTCAALANGGSTITTTLFGKNTGISDTGPLLALAYVLSGILLSVCYFIFNKKDKRTVEITWKNMASMLSVAVVLCIYLPVMLKGVKLFPASIYFPIIHTGIISVVSIVGVVAFKDKLKPSQAIGLIFGMTAIVLLAM